MKKTVCILMVLISLAACVTDTEMPRNNGTGSDLMRPSPCVCLELEYDGRGFEWRG
jgi:hypothetical protein